MRVAIGFVLKHEYFLQHLLNLKNVLIAIVNCSYTFAVVILMIVKTSAWIQAMPFSVSTFNSILFTANLSLALTICYYWS